MQTRRKGFCGFTLVELIAVILLIGVISAITIPRMVNLADTAHTETAHSVSGSLSSGVQLVYAAWLTQGKPANVVVDSRTVPVSSAGYPGADSPSASDCSRAWTNVLDGQEIQTGEPFGQPGWGATADGSNCLFSYLPDDDPLRRITYNTSTGRVSFNGTAGGGGTIDATLLLMLLLGLLYRLVIAQKSRRDQQSST